MTASAAGCHAIAFDFAAAAVSAAAALSCMATRSAYGNATAAHLCIAAVAALTLKLRGRIRRGLRGLFDHVLPVEIAGAGE